jgi:limonene 1,2-monooxygenase
MARHTAPGTSLGRDNATRGLDRMSDQHLRSGVFMAPFHATDDDPTLALRRDLKLIEWLDELGFEEAWLGEHHSAGFEIIDSPEVFIAAAAERTRRIRLGTGVVSLPYHNPLNVANRIIQLDHMTMGRVMLGVGPGALVGDAAMYGIATTAQRDRMAQSLDVIMRLFRGETVTEKTDWYELNEARLHLLPYSRPHPEVAVTSVVSPSGARAAGRYGLGMICVSATQKDAFEALSPNWAMAQEIAGEHGNVMDRSKLRLLGTLHLAETREQARENVRYGLEKQVRYIHTINPGRYGNIAGKDLFDVVTEGGTVIGTPDDAIAKIEALWEKQGGFGVFLQSSNNWANWEATKKSYELYARYVVPHFRGANRHRIDSLRWNEENTDALYGKLVAGTKAMIVKHQAERAAKGKAAAD